MRRRKIVLSAKIVNSPVLIAKLLCSLAYVLSNVTCEQWVRNNYHIFWKPRPHLVFFIHYTTFEGL